jgi:isochorismate synthase EntC
MIVIFTLTSILHPMDSYLLFVNTTLSSISRSKCNQLVMNSLETTGKHTLILVNLKMEYHSNLKNTEKYTILALISDTIKLIKEAMITKIVTIVLVELTSSSQIKQIPSVRDIQISSRSFTLKVSLSLKSI